jgi:hypothetical protein
MLLKRFGNDVLFRSRVVLSSLARLPSSIAYRTWIKKRSCGFEIIPPEVTGMPTGPANQRLGADRYARLRKE